MSPFDKAQAGQFSDLTPIQTGLKVEVELFQGFEPGQAGLTQAGFNAVLVATLPLQVEGLAQKAFVVQLLLGALLTDGVQLGGQIMQL